MTTYDLHIKGGTIVDGTRVPRYRGDVWVKDGKVAQMGGRAPGDRLNIEVDVMAKYVERLLGTTHPTASDGSVTA